MNLLITGVCGFVGSRLASAFSERTEGWKFYGLDNLLRPGSESNRAVLGERGVTVLHGDLRMRSDLEMLPPCDWVIDAAANPSVLAGIDGRSSTRQLSEHNLIGTLNLLEYCRTHKAGLVLLSTSRVYSIEALAKLPMLDEDGGFQVNESASLPAGVSRQGITEAFSTQQPISLYGATKLASEIMAIEYGSACRFPVWINRCGVLAGAGQFGTAEQGIFSYWLHAHAERRPLRYIGFGGRGFQVRDAFHPDDLAELILLQLERDPPASSIFHASGGANNAMSLAQLTSWCDERFGAHAPEPSLDPRPFDIPWLVMDHARTTQTFHWKPKRTLPEILDEIAAHAGANPGWLARCGVA